MADLYDTLCEAEKLYAEIQATAAEDAIDDDPRWGRWADLMDQAEEHLTEDQKISGVVCEFRLDMTRADLARLLAT